LLEAAARELPDDVKLDIFHGLAEIPPYNDDVEAPETVVVLRQALAAASAVLVATPEYNASVPGHLKNALDWASRPWPYNCLRGRPSAVIGASTGLFGAIWAQAEVRKVLNTIGARVVDEELPVSQVDSVFDEEGGLRDPGLRAKLADVLNQLITLV
jgi:chromate reductase